MLAHPLLTSCGLVPNKPWTGLLCGLEVGDPCYSMFACEWQGILKRKIDAVERKENRASGGMVFDGEGYFPTVTGGTEERLDEKATTTMNCFGCRRMGSSHLMASSSW